MKIFEGQRRFLISAVAAGTLMLFSATACNGQTQTSTGVDQPVVTQQEITPLEQGKWHTAADMSSHLQAAEHRPVADMNLAQASGRKAAVITATQDLSTWYILMGNMPLGQSTQFTLLASGTDLQVSDFRNVERPDFSERTYDRSKFQPDLDQIAQNTGTSVAGAFYDDIIEDYMQRFDERVAMQGEAENEVVVTVMANPNNQNDVGILLTYPGGGVTLTMGFGEDYSYANSMIAQFDQSSQ